MVKIPVNNVMYVCSSNRGRSPALAEYTFHYMPEYGLYLTIDSAGARRESVEKHLRTDPKANPQIRQTLTQQGIERIEAHRTKSFEPDVHGPWSDLILTADKANADRVLKALPGGIKKIYTARDFAGLEGSDIADAHYRPGGSKMYRDGIPKSSPEAWKLMAQECAEVSRAVLVELEGRETARAVVKELRGKL